MMDLPYPKITATDPAGQIAQLKSYLYQLIGQLNYQLQQLEKNTKKEGQG